MVKVLVVGDDSFTFTQCMLDNLTQWKDKIQAHHVGSNNSHNLTTSSCDEQWNIEMTSCLPLDKIPSEFLTDHHHLATDRNIPIHYSVNPALLRQYFSAPPFSNRGPHHGDPRPEPIGPLYDIILYLLPGIQFEGCPSIIPKISDLFKLRLHLFMFSLTKSATVISRPGALIMFLWVDQQSIQNSQPPHLQDDPTQTKEEFAYDPISGLIIEHPPKPMLVGNGNYLPFPLVDWEKLGPFCQIMRAQQEDFKLNLNWGEYKQKWKPIIYNLISIKFPEFLELTKTYCFRNIPAAKSTSAPSSAPPWACKDESTFLRIPSSVCDWDRSVLPHVNDLFHFQLRTNRPGEMTDIAKLSVKYDPRVSGWRNTGIGAPNRQVRQQANYGGSFPSDFRRGASPEFSSGQDRSFSNRERQRAERSYGPQRRDHYGRDFQSDSSHVISSLQSYQQPTQQPAQQLSNVRVAEPTERNDPMQYSVQSVHQHFVDPYSQSYNQNLFEDSAHIQPQNVERSFTSAQAEDVYGKTFSADHLQSSNPFGIHGSYPAVWDNYGPSSVLGSAGMGYPTSSVSVPQTNTLHIDSHGYDSGSISQLIDNNNNNRAYHGSHLDQSINNYSTGDQNYEFRKSHNEESYHHYDSSYGEESSSSFYGGVPDTSREEPYRDTTDRTINSTRKFSQESRRPRRDDPESRLDKSSVVSSSVWRSDRDHSTTGEFETAGHSSALNDSFPFHRDGRNETKDNSDWQKYSRDELETTTQTVSGRQSSSFPGARGSEGHVFNPSPERRQRCNRNDGLAQPSGERNGPYSRRRDDNSDRRDSYDRDRRYLNSRRN